MSPPCAAMLLTFGIGNFKLVPTDHLIHHYQWDSRQGWERRISHGRSGGEV